MNIAYQPLLYLLNRLDVIGKYNPTTFTTGLYYSELYTVPLEHYDRYNVTIVYSGRDASV